VDFSVYSLAPQTDGRVLIAGNFTTVDGQARTNIARLNSSGSLDPTFDPGLGVGGPLPYVNAVAVQTDGRVLIGGSFSNVGIEQRTNLARLNSSGSVDTDFTAETDDSVNALVIESNGSLLIGGFFTQVNGVARTGVARLNGDGTLDAQFNPVLAGEPFSTVFAMVRQSNGKILIGGVFTSVNEVACTNIARLNADGTLDTGFDPGAGIRGELSAAVYALAVDRNGKVLVGGDFTSVNGIARTNLARLNANGSLDPGFDPGTGTDFAVNSIAAQGDDKALIGGFFTKVSGTARNYVMRLNTDGRLDTSFDCGAGADAVIYSVALQSDGQALIGGGFATFNGSPRHGIARLNGDGATPGLRLFNPVRNGTAFSVSVVTDLDHSYVLEFKNALIDAWSALPAVAGDGTVKVLTDAGAGASHRIYRVRVD
jgi:uncharacterized delta-60 repeat protein